MDRVVQNLDVDDDEERLERVAAIDVAKASGKVCVRLPGGKRRVTKLWDVPSTTTAILALADELVGMGVERTVMESTSDYWRPFFYLLEASGLEVWLVDARAVKQVPGRPKTDKLDAVWLAKLNERGMLRPCFVPPGGDTPAARLHTAAPRPHPGPFPPQATVGEVAGGRLDQAVDGGHRHLRQVRTGDGGGAHRRRARPARARGHGVGQAASQARRVGRGAQRSLR